jgi:predicted ATPase
MLTHLTVVGYRSVRNLPVAIAPVTVFVGANGSGKTNVYRALRLLAEAAGGRLSRALASEGGLQSVLSASPSPTPCTTLELGCTIDGWSYELEIGLPPTGPATAFRLDPYVRRERLTTRVEGRDVLFIERAGVRTRLRDHDGRQVDLPHDLAAGESTLAQIRDPQRFPEFAALRQRILGWRFYHQFRTDEGSPLRVPQVGVFTPVLSHDGVDVAAAIQSVREHGLSVGGRKIDEWFMRALPDVSVLVSHDERALFEVMLQMRKVSRPLRASELSDGQLRLLCLVAALTSPRPSDLLVLNEPETSLHPDVLPVLAELVVAAARSSQIVVTTHDRGLAQTVAAGSGHAPCELELRDGETRVVGRGRYE